VLVSDVAVGDGIIRTRQRVPGIDSIFLYPVPDGYTIDPKHGGRPGLIAIAFYEGIDESLFFA
jgi:hypothetical protein